MGREALTALHRGWGVVLPRDAHGTHPVPADGAGGVAVPTAHVRRVAEWSLGDQVSVPASGARVTFSPARRRP